MSAKDVNSMTAVEIARRLAELGETEKALEAYAAALKQEKIVPEERMEAACAVLQYGSDYKAAYDAFLSLYEEGAFREDVLDILTEAFYRPNEETMREQYEKNCRLLKKYPYLFRKDFLPFEALPVKFYPYDDKGVLPYDTAEERFDRYTDLNEPEIRHYFFRDLEKPVLATDIFSQYELEYLRDNVRRSEWVGRENHIYLHYRDWGVFCSYLQCWDMKTLLKENKFVFLIGEELARYPIDFKEAFGVDYSEYPVKPLGIREIKKIVWHTQLLYHNGGDFFNEILHGHPYMLADDSAMFDDTLEVFERLLNCAGKIARSKGDQIWKEDAFEILDPAILKELVELKDRTLKDAMVAYYLGQKKYTRHLDPAARVAPPIVYQPHFGNMYFKWDLHESGGIIPRCSAYEDIKKSGLLQGFRYIKSFTPMRRPTNSHAAAVSFAQKQIEQGHKFSENPNKENLIVIVDTYFDRIMNRSFMVDDEDRLLRDSRLVRFEDAKLDPTAVFTALAEFLDVPYTESMTYCSYEWGVVENGFDTAALYRTREEFADEYERRLMEYLLRDLYEFYGYGFHYYDGKPMTQEEIEELLGMCHTNEDFVRASWRANRARAEERFHVSGEELDKLMEELEENNVSAHKATRLLAIRILRHGLGFCSERGVPLRLMTPLALDESKLEQPRYH